MPLKITITNSWNKIEHGVKWGIKSSQGRYWIFTSYFPDKGINNREIDLHVGRTQFFRILRSRLLLITKDWASVGNILVVYARGLQEYQRTSKNLLTNELWIGGHTLIPFLAVKWPDFSSTILVFMVFFARFR